MRSCVISSQSLQTISRPTELSMSWTAIRVADIICLSRHAVGRWPELLSQFSLQQFARAGLGQTLHEFHRAWALVVGQPRAAEVDQFRFADLSARLEYHDSLGHLAPDSVRHGDNNHFVNAGMCGERLFYFQRSNVLAATDNDVLLAIDNKNVVVAIDRRNVSGVEPAILHHLIRRRRLSPVALHHAVAARDNFAHRLSIVRNLVAVAVNDAQFNPGDRESSAGLVYMSFVLAPRHCWFYRGCGQYRRSLRKTVAGEANAAEFLFHFANQGGRGSSAADGDRLQT